MNRNDIFDDDEFTFGYDNYKIKPGFVDHFEKEGICANCFEIIIQPFPMTGIWKHRGSGYFDSCENPVPAPTMLLLQMINRPVLPEHYRKQGRGIACKKHYHMWDELINQHFGFPKYRQGWMSGHKTHFLGKNYQTLCGIIINYNKRTTKIHTSTKTPERDYWTCKVCLERSKKL